MRIAGFAPIEDYAALADGRVVALIAKDGSVDWLSIPTMDGTSVFGALLDPERGGRFALRPVDRFEAERRYLPGSNVLETTFETASGRLRVTDALTLQDGGLLPWIELARRIECLRGSVRMRWSCEPRFDFGRVESRIARVCGAAVAHGGARDRLALLSWGAGEPELTTTAIAGESELSRGDSALLACICVDNEPIPLPTRPEVEGRVDGTVETWRRWFDLEHPVWWALRHHGTRRRAIAELVQRAGRDVHAVRLTHPGEFDRWLAAQRASTSVEHVQPADIPTVR